MDGRFQPRQRSQGQRSQDVGDRRFDQWLETGRQLVDGVAGTRPGRRSAGGPRPSMDFESVGRWVGDKIDWLMDEEEDWRDPVEPPQRADRLPASSRKRPLDAISRRQLLGSLLRQCLSLSPPMEGMTTAGLMTKASVWSGGPVLQRPHQQRQRPCLSPVVLPIQTPIASLQQTTGLITRLIAGSIDL